MTETMSRSATAATDAERTPDAIMQIGTGFWPAKTLLSAVELGLFHLLSSNPLTASEIATRLELRSPRGTRDLLDGLFASACSRADPRPPVGIWSECKRGSGGAAPR